MKNRKKMLYNLSIFDNYNEIKSVILQPFL